MTIKIALPKGRLLGKTASLLQTAGCGLHGYTEKSRLYRFKSQKFRELSAKIFHEKDIPIQVAVGNYDLGICGLDWIEELLVKYPSSSLVKIKNLGYGNGALYMAYSVADAVLDRLAGRNDIVSIAKGMQEIKNTVRIASEYPNLAESFAAKNRLRRFSIIPLWGAAEAYPPEDADLALISSGAGNTIFNNGLEPLSMILKYGAFLIANKNSWETKDMGEILSPIGDVNISDEKYVSSLKNITETSKIIGEYKKNKIGEETIRLALPDGHQQQHTLKLLNKAGIQIDDYPSENGNCRPNINLAGVLIKVIRPQDMPLQVANGNFDLAITGKDWFFEHKYQFPSSPIKKLLDLGFGKVKIVAVVSKDLSVNDIYDIKLSNADRVVPLRIATEYVNIADKYARDNHLGLYRVVPTWGATEAFLPEDADLLIENTETGRTIARHNLKIIDTLFESTACLIGSTDKLNNSIKSKRINNIIETLRNAVRDS
ncbi:MAG: ATP phosphoribosyltransferase [Dehalococcoidales bacterium]|nr:ATP phosphoribosyltransferase [Dehalococcoidales bacterium]